MPTGITSVESNSSARSPVLRALARPRVLALGCVAVLVAAGWAYLGLILAGQSGRGIFQALCQPINGTDSSDAAGAVLTFAMWCAMTLATMLPTAVPMIVTYADLADTAAAKGEPAGSPLTLIAGYVAVWFAAAAVFTALQVLLTRWSMLDADMASASLLFSGALALIAGVYQLSAFKFACMTHCQRPLPFFFANWTARPAGVFRLGVRQGLYCVGCCWAMMLLMFAFGVMNVVWMAIFGAVMTIEKLNATLWVNRALGVIFVAAGMGLTGEAVMALWSAMPR
jgi:predicted metal-binding membrane protein